MNENEKDLLIATAKALGLLVDDLLGQLDIETYNAIDDMKMALDIVLDEVLENAN
jgi:hypothetical protein